jgi:hypothetical protein
MELFVDGMGVSSDNNDDTEDIIVVIDDDEAPPNCSGDVDVAAITGDVLLLLGVDGNDANKH